jgi:hypothetical protein
MNRKIPQAKKKPAVAQPLRRRVHISYEQWTYEVGNSGVAIVSPDGAKTRVPMTEISGLSWDEPERARNKGCGFEVTPQLVKSYIQLY